MTFDLIAESLSPERLESLADEHRSGFASGSPFPHVVIDDFLLPECAAELVAAFPSRDEGSWDHYQDGGRTEKLAISAETAMPPIFRQLVWGLNSGPSVCFLERLTGIDGLVADPHLVGGGLHRIEAGGFLDVHADFNRHTVLRLDRRLNLLLYLNPDWDDSWGGSLELWEPDGDRAARRIAPVLNRCVVFATTDGSLHGHPHPLACPPERARCSVALYYYTNGRPSDEQSAPHSTLYVGADRPPSGSRRAAKVSRTLRRLAGRSASRTR